MRSRASRSISYALFLVALLVLLIGCAARPAPAQQLRVVNASGAAIVGLTVLFPGSTSASEALRVEFGDLPPGTTTDYREVQGGVYRYAAYSYSSGGQTITQSVTDWVGERPMTGSRFTYRIAVDPKLPPGGQIQLLEAVVDAP